MHTPVLVTEVLSILKPTSGKRIIDATFGGGGHSIAILGSSDCYVLGMDRDPDAIDRAVKVKAEYPSNFDFVLGEFDKLANLTGDLEKFDGILFDFGVSSFQIDDSSRGFAFSHDGKLDMRMSKCGLSAFDVINSFEEKDLAEIIWKYGDEPKSREIAAEIAKARKISKITTTFDLRHIIRNVFRTVAIKKKHSKLDVATKTFQAIRIFVNNELSQIDTALRQLPQFLKSSARIATISFHALEDRIVKNWARSNLTNINYINKSIIKPSNEEIKKNPRARSAILRGFVYNESEVGRQPGGDWRRRS
ncbi:MAG: 16S rRNA (cytosine(1402)-N(4))-methyltransferase RsmH [Holosporales bacterium]|jgi:16S rRNA (cytosine1402-N4)-methyltransferase|nr:16S rRNA (cytosine(1402)-N(4))-methyltransferase RsmH [Holosporales bacterium]